MFKKAITLTSILFLFIFPALFVLSPINLQAASDCGQSADNPATPVNETLSCNGLVPCSGIDCTICDFFKLFQNVLNMAFKLAPLIAVILVCVAGYYFLVSGGEPGKITKARGILWNTFIGIIIFYSSYTLASFVLGFFANLNGGIDFGFKFESKEGWFSSSGFTFNCSGGEIENKIGNIAYGGAIVIDLPDAVGGLAPDGETEITGGAFTGESRPSGDGAFVSSSASMNVKESVRNAFERAGEIALQYNPPFALLVVSGKRDLAKQNELVARNCPSGATSSTQCNPPTCIPSLSSGCPHIAGKALDIWAVNVEGNKQNSAMQNAAINVLKQAGFCRYTREAWHFELKSDLQGTPRMGAFDCD